MSIQKRALELESVAELQRIVERSRKQRYELSTRLSQAVDVEINKMTEKLHMVFRRLSSRIDSIEDLTTRARSSILRAASSFQDLKRSQSTQLSQLQHTQRSLLDQIESDRDKIEDLETRNAQLRTSLAAERKAWEQERAELTTKISREQKYAHEAELARRESALNESVNLVPKHAPPPLRATGEVAALIEELHALEAEAQRLVPRSSR